MWLIGRRTADLEEEQYSGVDADEQAPVDETNDLLTLLDRLEHELTGSGRIPMTGRMLVDEEAIYATLDQIRTLGQAGIRQARAIVRHRDQILEESRQEAERIISDATAQARALTADRGLAERAERRSREILDDAERRAREHEGEADDYAGQVLLRLREHLVQLRSVLQEGEVSSG